MPIDDVRANAHVGGHTRMRLPRILEVEGAVAIALRQSLRLARRLELLVKRDQAGAWIVRIDLPQLFEDEAVVHVVRRLVPRQSWRRPDSRLELVRTAPAFLEIGEIASKDDHRRGRLGDRLHALHHEDAGGDWDAARQ